MGGFMRTVRERLSGCWRERTRSGEGDDCERLRTGGGETDKRTSCGKIAREETAYFIFES